MSSSTIFTRNQPEKAPRPRRDIVLGSDKARPLPDGALACASCGDEVRHPSSEQTESMQLYRQQPHSAASRGIPTYPEIVLVSRCGKCADRRVLATALVERHHLGRVYGNVAVDRVDAALAALDLLGIRGQRGIASLTRTPAAIRELVAALAHIGGGASWSARLANDALWTASAPRRWAGVSTELRDAASEAYRELFHRRAEVPMPYAPPAEDGAVRGCLMCGRGTLTVKASDAKAAWGELRRVEVGNVGGKIGPKPVAGFLCPDCRESVELVGGAIGLPAIERAVLRHLGYRLSGGTIERWPGVLAWVALPAGTEPNRMPWGHLPLASLARGLDRTMHVVPDRAAGRAR